MGDKTKIQWSNATWTPIRARNLVTGKVGWHCEHVTSGCEFCYAESLNLRLGTGLPFKPGHRKDIEIFLDEKMLLAPLRWKKPRMIFVCSMTDLFADFVEVEWIDKMFAVMALSPQHTFQVLTKRPERMRAYCSHPGTVRRIYETACSMTIEMQLGVVLIAPGVDEALAPPGTRINLDQWPLPNVWLGTSTEDQGTFDERWPALRETPAAVRFLSIEPQIGRVDMCEALGMWWNQTTDSWVLDDGIIRPDWAIIGGESGPKARDFHFSWARSLIEQCAGAGIACFVKQMGSAAVDDSGYRDISHAAGLKDRKGGDIEEWPEDLRIREFPRIAT